MSETPLSLAAKLRQIGYLEPVLPPPSGPIAGDQLAPVRPKCAVRNCGHPARYGDTMCLDCSEETEAMARYLRARAEHLRLIEARPTLWSRFVRVLGALWSRFPGHLSLLCAIGLTFILCRYALTAEVPDRIVAALCQVETGTTWRGFGDVRGSWSRGLIGESGPWQLSPAVLRDLHAYDRRHRVHADPVLAESLTRAWLLRLYAVTGCWSQTCAAFHGGLSGRHRPHAREYAARVLALASAL